MKSLENKAGRYDEGIKTLTLGKYPKIKQCIIDEYLEEGETLLDIGMGIGTFAIRCAKKGVSVMGIDVSAKNAGIEVCPRLLFTFNEGGIIIWKYNSWIS